jgi:hypothetical protein
MIRLSLLADCCSGTVSGGRAVFGLRRYHVADDFVRRIKAGSDFSGSLTAFPDAADL